MSDESLYREVDEEVRDFFGEIVYKTVIPRDDWIHDTWWVPATST